MVEQADLRTRITDYLRERVETGSPYVKSREIARELDVSVKRTGLIMGRLERESSDLQLKRWGGSSDGTTWYVEHRR